MKLLFLVSDSLSMFPFCWVGMKLEVIAREERMGRGAICPTLSEIRQRMIWPNGREKEYRELSGIPRTLDLL